MLVRAPSAAVDGRCGAVDGRGATIAMRAARVVYTALMARPANAQPELTIEAILQAALALISESRRVDDLSLRSVAGRAGVSLSTVQYYFETRDALLDACLQGYHERLSELARRLAAEFAGSDAPLDALIERTVRAFFQFTLAEKTLIQLRMSTTLTYLSERTLARDALGASLIKEGANAIAPKLGMSPIDVRFALQTLAAAIVRVALSSDVELRSYTDARGAGAVKIAEDQMVKVARVLLGPR